MTCCCVAARASLLGAKTNWFTPQPKLGRFTRSPGEVNRICSIIWLMWLARPVWAVCPLLSNPYG